MSDALIDSLNRRITELEQRAVKLQAAVTQARHEGKDLRARSSSLEEQVQHLTSDRDGWKQKAESGPQELQARIAELEGQVRQRDHRDAFRQAATTSGVSPAFVDDLYTLSGLKPGDAPAQPGEFAEFFAAAQTSRPWAFGASPPPGQSGTPTPSGQNGASQGVGLQGTSPPPGAGRSASSAPANGVRYTASEVRKPGWQQARPELVEALQKGTAIFVE